MENVTTQKKALAKSTLPYGIIFGAIMILEFVIGYSFGLNAQKTPWVGVVMTLLNYLILPILFILLACNNFKNKINGGYITFGQAIKAGVSVCVIAALTFSIFNSLFYIIIPESKELIIEQTREAYAKSPGMTAAALEQTMKMTELFMEPYLLIPVTIFMFTVLGLILSLIVGAIVKKENPYGDLAPNVDNVGNEQ
jgi:hypothetical protein